MSYVESHLMPGERLIYSAQLHWILYEYAAVAGVLGLLLIVTGVTAVGLALLALAALVALVAYLRITSSEFALTDQRVLIKVGLLNTRSVETLLSKVEGIGVEQKLSGKLWGYGTIVVTGTGGTHERFDGIADPLEFRQQVQQQIALAQRTRPVVPGPQGREERECPYCAERILAKARVCKHCGREVQPLTT